MILRRTHTVSSSILTLKSPCISGVQILLVPRNVSTLLIKLVAAYSIVVVALVSVLTLFFTDDAGGQAIIKMALGLIFLWIVVGGTIMLRFRDKISDLVRRVPLGWKPRFVLFATSLALIEEAIATTMTNLAPFFGSQIGEAYITASTNYLHVILFHSVILFIPMFVAWAWLLSRYDFTPNAVFLLFGLVGSIAEASINPTSLIGGFWFFIYGLMVYLPAYSTPADRGARVPRFPHYILAVVLPFLFAAPVAFVVGLVREWLAIPLFTI